MALRRFPQRNRTKTVRLVAVSLNRRVLRFDFAFFGRLELASLLNVRILAHFYLRQLQLEAR